MLGASVVDVSHGPLLDLLPHVAGSAGELRGRLAAASLDASFVSPANPALRGGRQIARQVIRTADRNRCSLVAAGGLSQAITMTPGRLIDRPIPNTRRSC